MKAAHTNCRHVPMNRRSRQRHQAVQFDPSRTGSPSLPESAPYLGIDFCPAGITTLARGSTAKRSHSLPHTISTLHPLKFDGLLSHRSNAMPQFSFAKKGASTNGKQMPPCCITPASSPSMGAVVIDRRLRVAILVYLWAAVTEDTILFVLAWVTPDLWFRILHASAPAGLEVALLRRSAGQWAAFALAQAVALWCWRKKPEWLAVVAGVRFSDLLTDISYILAVPALTRVGWVILLPLPLLNLVGVVIMLRGYEQARSFGRSTAEPTNVP
jgi:hypothetical protein